MPVQVRKYVESFASSIPCLQIYTSNTTCQGGLSLNIFGALSGVFSGKSKKTTDTAADGSSKSVERRRGTGHVDGAGGGTLSAVGQGTVQSQERYRMVEEGMQAQEQGRKTLEKNVDHLGIESAPMK
jgi:hypothetical protein